MPLYMDHHKNVEGLSAEAVAEAHKKDLEVQEEHGVKYHRYWYNEQSWRGLLPVRSPACGSGGNCPPPGAWSCGRRDS
jgi:Protein of unknown function (DUF4242)